MRANCKSYNLYCPTHKAIKTFPNPISNYAIEIQLKTHLILQADNTLNLFLCMANQCAWLDNICLASWVHI